MSLDLQLHDILKSEFNKLSTQLHTRSSQTGLAGTSTSASQGQGNAMISDELACSHSHATDHHMVDCPNAPEEVILLRWKLSLWMEPVPLPTKQ